MTAHRLTLAALLTACLALAAGCGGSGKSPSTASPRATATPVPQATISSVKGPSILSAKTQSTSFGEVQERVSDLYREHGTELSKYSYQDVRYTTKTLEKVLNTCHTAGPTDGVAGLASTKAVGCAPLIFYYYNYGAQTKVQSSIDLAQRLYWYALTHEEGPKGANASLTKLLRSWGIS
jgi:hypothetical protein